MNSNKDYMVNVRTIYRYGRISEERLHIKLVLAHVINGHTMRLKEWLESAHPWIPDYKHPFKISKIKFDKKTGNLEFLEVTQQE